MQATAESLQEQVKALRGDRAHGAAFLAQRAIWTLAQVASGSGVDPEWVKEASQQLAEAKPAMASVANGLLLLLTHLQDAGWDIKKAPALASGLIGELQRWTEEAAAQTAVLLPADGVVLTCSYSSTVVQTLAAADRRGRHLRMLALPSAGYGRLMADEASEAGVEVQVVNTLPKGATAADTVGLVGADTVSPNAFVLNGAPSLGLARWCTDRGLPFYVVCDSLKVLTGQPNTRAPLPRGIERIPMRFVTAVVTEKGPAAQGRRGPAS